MATNNTVRCCSVPKVDAVVDFSVTIGSAIPFLERIGAIATVRRPHARIEPRAHRVHSIPLTTPLPLPNTQRHLNGTPPPDRGQTYDWPHPELSEEPT